MKTIKVVAAIIVQNDLIFATQRGYGEFKDGWEFPGGKVEPGESPEQALIREIKEELDTEIEVGVLFDTVEYDYPEFHLSMDCFLCRIKKGTPVLKEHEAAKWLSKENLDSVAWLPADLGLIKKIKKELPQNIDQDKKTEEPFEFRYIKPEECDQAATIEQICFPPHEACSKEDMVNRVKAVPDLFLVAVDKEKGKIAGFLNGIATDEEVFFDKFFTNPELHDPNGANVMLLGLDVLPEYRGQGLAHEIVARYCQNEALKGRKQLILTCLESRISLYEEMGFEDCKLSNSTWGDETWYDMTYHLTDIAD